MMRLKLRSGFSLIEVLAAVMIAAGLATIAVSQLRRPGDLAHSQACELCRETLQNEVGRYVNETGTSPSSNLQELTAAGHWNGPLPTCPSTGRPLTLDRTGTIDCPVH